MAEFTALASHSGGAHPTSVRLAMRSLIYRAALMLLVMCATIGIAVAIYSFNDDVDLAAEGRLSDEMKL